MTRSPFPRGGGLSDGQEVDNLKIDYLIPDEGALISPQNGFFVGGSTYINPNDVGGADIAMIAPPLTMARIDAAGFIVKSDDEVDQSTLTSSSTFDLDAAPTKTLQLVNHPNSTTVIGDAPIFSRAGTKRYVYVGSIANGIATYSLVSTVDGGFIETFTRARVNSVWRQWIRAEATKLASYDDAGDLRGFGQDVFDDDANGSYLGWYFVFEDDSKNQDITLSSGAIFRGVQS